MNMDKLTIKAQEALQSANTLAENKGHAELLPEHLALALIDRKSVV